MNDWVEADQKNIWHPFTPLKGASKPVFIKSAEGIFLHTADGRKIIDAVSSWWVNLHGHSNPYIAEAIARQARTLEHVIFAGFTHKPAITLSENLLSILPPNQKKVFFSDDGSTAVEVAVKIALQYWYNQGKPKQKIIALSGAYHGDTFGSMSVGERSIFTNAFSRHLFEVSFIDFPARANADNALIQFKRIVDEGNVAAFIFEPLVQGAAGMRMYEANVLDELIRHAKQNEVLCIADEVFTGFGRTGKLFASLYLKNHPDIIAVSKGITGGVLPLGVTSCSEEILHAFETEEFSKTFFHGHSYTANPLACAAANASFDLLMSVDCQRQIEMISRSHHRYASKLRSNPKVSDARSLGTILAIEIQSDKGTSYDNDIRKKIYPYFLNRDILLRPLGNIMYVLPPYVITESQLETIYSAIDSFLENEV